MSCGSCDALRAVTVVSTLLIIPSLPSPSLQIAMVDEDPHANTVVAEEDSPAAMDHAKKVMVYVGWGLSLVLIVVWPLLALPAGVFSKSYFTFWVSGDGCPRPKAA